nr:PH domain-containing protein [Corynebacterium sp. TAE3-ERU12]
MISLLWWRVTGYRISAEEIAFHNGLLNRNVRTARFDRVQAVDVVESFLPRLCGLADVRVETAGGKDSALVIGLLTKPEAESLRRELLTMLDAPSPISEAALSPVPRETPHSVATSAQRQDAAGEKLVPTIPIGRSLAGAALSGQTIFVAISIAVGLLTPFGAGVIPLLIAVVPSVWNVLNRSWKFTAVDNGDVVVITYGLAERRSQTVKKKRIHGITITQPLLWRVTGWWKISIDVAGYGELLGSESTSVVLPVGSLAQVRAVLSRISPLSDAELDVHGDPTGAETATYRSPKQTRWCSPVDWRQHAVTLLSDDGGHPRAVVTRKGRLSRTLNMVATKHIQELTWSQGPILRLLGLAEVTLDLVNGPVIMSGPEIAEADADELLEVLRSRSLPELTPVDPDVLTAERS